MKTKLSKFNPSIFGSGWSIESDNGVTDYTNVALKSYLATSSESYITGEEARTRMEKAGNTPLSADVAQYFKENPSEYPEAWKNSYVHFDGTTLRGPRGRRCALYAYWGDGRVVLRYYWLGDRRGARSPSALLASTKKPESLTLGALPLDRLEKLERFYEKAIKLMPGLEV